VNAVPSPAAPRPRSPERLARFSPRFGRRPSVLYSRFVGLLKLVLPATAIGLAGMVVFWPSLLPDNMIRPKPVHVGVEDLENLRMVNPRFVGTDSQNQPYVLSADLATQQSATSPTTLLDKPKGDIALKNGAWLALTAERGVYEKKEQTLDLLGSVNLFHDRGYEITTEQARVYLDKGLAEGDQPVQGQGPDVELSGDRGFRLEDKGARIIVFGNSRLMFYPEAAKAPPDGGTQH
jgi:lipopolysaccharide export system protein LptC